MAGWFGRLARRTARRMGHDIQPWPSLSAEAERLAELLALRGIDHVLDVGANVGQYGQWLRRIGYAGRITSFEPVSAAHGALSAAAAGDGMWRPAPPMALGAEAGTLEMRLTTASDMNSALPLSGAAAAAFPRLAETGRETVPQHRLDQIFGDFVEPGQQVYLKIDTQGFDLKVLEGASGVMDRIAGVQMELPLITLYEGQPDLAAHLSMMQGLGFSPHWMCPVSWSRKLGRHLEIDCAFFRPA